MKLTILPIVALASLLLGSTVIAKPYAGRAGYKYTSIRADDKSAANDQAEKGEKAEEKTVALKVERSERVQHRGGRATN